MTRDPDGRAAGPPPSQEDVEASRQPSDEPSVPSVGGSSAGAALGAAMLGLDMALRREPPAQVVAAEHQPERSLSGDEGDVVIVLPERHQTGGIDPDDESTPGDVAER